MDEALEANLEGRAWSEDTPQHGQGWAVRFASDVEGEILKTASDQAEMPCW